jgi:hypothetical protein
MTDHWPDLPDHDALHDSGLHDHEPLGHDLAAEHAGWHLDVPEPVHHDEVALHLDPVHHDAGVTAVDRDVLADVYGVEPGALAEAADRLGLPPEVDGYGAAVLLGELGVDAAVLHGDVDGLAAEVDAGHEVVVHGVAGRLTVVAVDGSGVELQDGTGAVTRVELPAFEDAWAQASYAMVVADPAPLTGEIVLETGPVTVLGMSWPPES